MSRIRPLTQTEARGSLAARMGARADRVRQLATKLGLRPYRVFLVWTRWTGAEDGEGNELLVAREEILPTPVVTDLSNVALRPMSAGLVQEGTLKIERVSTSFTRDQLMGKTMPVSAGCAPGAVLDFFYEVVEDARAGENPPRPRYRLGAVPYARPGKQDWLLVLERAEGGDMEADGRSRRRYLPPGPG